MTKEEAIKYLSQLYPKGGHCWLDEKRQEAIGLAIDALKEEQLTRSVTKTSDKEEPVSENLEKAAIECCSGNSGADARVRAAFVMGARWQRNNVWHDAKKEKPVYDSNIAVIRHPSDDVSMSVCAMVSDDIIYSPVARKEYKWGSCPFTHWAYIEDLLPNGKEE